MDKYTTDGSEIPLRSAQMLNQQDETIAALRARVAELARLVESAYAEGFYRAQQGGVDWDNRPNEWKGSNACAALQEGE